MRTPKATVMRRAGSICVLAVAAALTMTACSDESGESTETRSDAGDSQPSDEPDESDDSEQSDDSPAAGAPDGEQAVAQATASEAVETWVTAIVENEPVNACLTMGTSESTPAANSAEMCEDGNTGAEQARQLVDTLHPSFTPANLAEPPVTEVAEGLESGGTAAFDAQQISVDGQTLRDIVVSNSTGVEPEDIGIEISATEIDGLWYVTDMDLAFG